MVLILSWEHDSLQVPREHNSRLCQVAEPKYKDGPGYWPARWARYLKRERPEGTRRRIPSSEGEEEERALAASNL